MGIFGRIKTNQGSRGEVDAQTLSALASRFADMAVVATLRIAADKMADAVGTSSDPENNRRIHMLSVRIRQREDDDKPWAVDGLALYRDSFTDGPAQLRVATQRLGFVSWMAARMTWAEAANVALNDPTLMVDADLDSPPEAYLAAADWLAERSDPNGAVALADMPFHMRAAADLLAQTGFSA